MLKIVKWITSLDTDGKRIVAILLFGVMFSTTMWIKVDHSKSSETLRHEKEEEAYKEILIQRTDAFNEAYRKSIIECNEKIEKFLIDQLNKSESTLIKANKLVEKNEKLIKKVKTN